MPPCRSSLRRSFLLVCLLLTSCASPVTSQQTPTTAASAVPSPGATSTLPLRVLPEKSSQARLSSTPDEGTASPNDGRRSVIVISWDGGQAASLYSLMDAGLLPHFASLAKQGARAEYALSIDPPLTFSAHNSLSTGSYPARTGIVSNAYHNPNDSFYWYRSGVEQPLDAAEPVWVTASRAGLTTATVVFPGGSPTMPAQMADYSIDYGVRDAYSRQATVPLSQAEGWEGPPASFSPILEGVYQVPEVAKLHLLVVDTSDDQAVNYDAVLLLPDHDTRLWGARRVDPGALRLRAGEWGSLLLEPEQFIGADFLVQAISSQEITIFHTTVSHNRAAPRELLEALNRRFGFFPSGGDAYALEHGWITEEDYLHQIERFSLWLAEVTAWVYGTYHPDLLFAWQENFDTAGHAFFLQDPRQAGYTPEKAERYAGYYRRAAQAADLALGKTLESVDLKRTAVFLVADHGMAPAHTNVNVNTILERAGLLVLDKKNYVVVNKTKAFAVASGAAVNVYINLRGREVEGIVPEAEYSALQDRVITLLSELKDPQTGEPVFQRTLPRSELASLGLDHPNSGDVFAQANPGYSLDGWRGNKEVYAPLQTYGQHGYDSSLPEMHTLFVAAGGGVPAEVGLIPPVRLIDIAPTIAALLGFAPALTVDGTQIKSLVHP